jgi:hypothetical protein
MSYRRHGSKTTIALWMLVAVGDVALILASAGVVALVALVGVVALAVGMAGAWLLLRRGVTGEERVAAPVPVPGRVPARRRA